MKITLKLFALVILMVAFALQIKAGIGDFNADPIYHFLIISLWLSYMLNNIANIVKK